jgi:hypothetical protein
MAHSVRLFSFSLLVVLLCIPAKGQISTRVASVSTGDAVAGMPVHVTVDLRQTTGLQAVLLLYRSFGESEYRRIDMDIIGNRATAQIPASAIIPPSLEYYLVLRDLQGSFEVYPLSDSPDPLTTPPQSTQRLQIRDRSQAEPQAIFLSPDPLSVFSPQDVLISVSLLRADSTVARGATQLLLDGVEVTAQALFSGDLIVFVPANVGMLLEPGSHTVSLRLLDRNGNIQHESTVSFMVQADVPLFRTESTTAAFRYNASLQLESRYEDLGTSNEWYNRARVLFRGQTGSVRFQSNLFVTSDEKADRQPQNRYFLGVELPWLKVGVGDSYPEFPDLVLSGKRVRGVNSSLLLGTFNVDLAYGSVTRAIDGALLKRFPVDSLIAEQRRDPRAAFGQLDPANWGKFSYGTYERTLFAVRPSFGSGETWQLGFTWLSGRDDLESIRYGIRPQENIVLGTDFFTRFDDGRIELRGDAAFSAFNSDISSGPFTDAYIDSVYPDDASAIKTARDVLDPFITVNDNLRPLSFKKLATVAGQAGLGLNYFDNALKVTYLYRGNDYNSFGQTYLRTDIRGFNVVDRIHLLRNQVFATIGIERLHDNTAGTKSATTTFANLNAAVSLYLLTNFPGLTLGYSRFDNDNELPTDSLAAVRDVTNRIYLQSTYSFELGVQHTAMLSISSSVRDDYTTRRQNVRNRSLAVGVGSRYPIRLQTELSLALNLNDFPDSTAGTSRRFNYTILTLYGRYELLQNELTCTASFGPTFGDFTRTVLDAGLEWRLSPPMTLSIQASTFKSSTVPSENFLSLQYRYDF